MDMTGFFVARNADGDPTIWYDGNNPFGPDELISYHEVRHHYLWCKLVDGIDERD